MSREPCLPPDQSGAWGSQETPGRLHPTRPRGVPLDWHPGQVVDGPSWAEHLQLQTAGPVRTSPFCGGNRPAVGAGKGGEWGGSGLLQLGVLPQGCLSTVIMILLLLYFPIIRSFFFFFSFTFSSKCYAYGNEMHSRKISGQNLHLLGLISPPPPILLPLGTRGNFILPSRGAPSPLERLWDSRWT